MAQRDRSRGAFIFLTRKSDLECVVNDDPQAQGSQPIVG